VFTKAVADLNRIRSAQLAAVLNGDGFQFQKEFAEALDRKEKPNTPFWRIMKNMVADEFVNGHPGPVLASPGPNFTKLTRL
jgi:hypothetical protein